MGFTSATVKYILFIFNFFIAVCGAAIFGVAIYIMKGDQGSFTKVTGEDTITTPCVVLAIAGAFVFIVAFLGCCGAIQESYCMMILYAIILLAVLFVQAGIVGLAVYKKGSIETAYKTGMEKTFANYTQNAEPIDAMQRAFECCGPDDYTFYGKHNIEIPDSCYKDAKDKTTLHGAGCVQKFTDFIKSNLDTVTKVVIGVGIVEIVAVVFGLYYAGHIRRYSERGYA